VEPLVRTGIRGPIAFRRSITRSASGFAQDFALRLRSGQALRAQTPAKRLKFESRRPCQLSRAQPFAKYEAPRISTQASHGPDEIDENASMVVLQVSQLVGEIGEVIADTSLQVRGDAMVDRSQSAAAALTDIRELKRSHLGQGVPLLEEPVVHAQNF